MYIMFLCSLTGVVVIFVILPHVMCFHKCQLLARYTRDRQQGMLRTYSRILTNFNRVMCGRVMYKMMSGQRKATRQDCQGDLSISFASQSDSQLLSFFWKEFECSPLPTLQYIDHLLVLIPLQIN